MKRILLGFAAFALISTSCQQSEVIENIDDGSSQLKFGVYQGKATKAAELKNSDLNKNGVKFPLHAYRGKQSLAKADYFTETLTYGTPVAGQWNTGIPRFLTDKDPLQFYAYYPETNVTGYTYDLTPGAYPSFDYAIEKNAVDAAINPGGTDIDMVAAKVIDHSGTSVTIPFQHILSQINFGVRGYYGAKIAIKDIVINQVKKEGTFTYNATNGVWTNKRTLEDYTYTFPEFITPGGVFTTTWEDTNKESDNTYIFGDGGNWGPGRDTKGEKIWYVTDDNTTIQGSKIKDDTPGLFNSLMLMPQELAIGTTEAYVTFNYTIQDLDDHYVVGGPLATNTVAGKFDLKMDVKEPYSDKWQPNLRYVYIIDFTGYLDGQKLTFDVDVESQPWENYNPDNGDDGIVLLSSVGEPMFKTKIQGLTNGQNYDIPTGHVFSDIAWDWSLYSMTSSLTTLQSFTIKFANVKFNGNKITVKPPFGFLVNTAPSIDVSSPSTVLTFKPTGLNYYGNVTDLDAAIVAGLECNTNNAIKLSELISVSTLAPGEKVVLHFANSYSLSVPKNWELTPDGKTATYTAPTPAP